MNAPDNLSRPELRWLPVDRLKADARYQRSTESRASQNLIAKIEREFRWFKFQAILAAPAEEPGWWNILDGQHRVAGVQRRGDIPAVPSLVIAETDWQMHAAAFVGANRDRVAVNAYAMHRARCAARDPDALTIEGYAKSAGIIIPPYPQPESKMKPGETAALGVFVRVPERYGPAIARATFQAVADAYRDEPGGMRAVYFDAVARIIADRGGTVPPELVPALRRTTASALLDEIHLRKGRVGGTMLNAAIAVIGLRLTKAGVSAPQQSKKAVAPAMVGAVPAAPKLSAAAWSPPVRTDPAAQPPAPAPTLAPPSDPRQAEIDAFIAKNGVRKVPSAYALPTQAEVPQAEAARRIADMKLPEPKPLTPWQPKH